MALMDYEYLPPGYWEENVAYHTYPRRDGSLVRRAVVVKLPRVLCEGPVVKRDQYGIRYLLYMVDYYLFVWPQDTAVVSVYHGTMKNHTPEPMWSFVCERPWLAPVLVVWARHWAQANDAQFKPPTREQP
jgi:hypothetical protein